MFLGIENADPTREALVDMHGGALGYGELAREIAAMRDVMPGRVLAFCLCRNVVGCVVGYLAMVEAGMVPVMLSASMDAGLLARLMEVYRPEYVWAPEGMDEGEPAYGAHGYRLTRTGEGPCPMHEDLQLCMSTSGSTGDPKLVRYKRGNLEANARNVAAAFGWSEEERGLCDLGLQYTMGLNVLNSHLVAGATSLLCDANPLSSDYWDYMRGQRASNVTGVPFTYDIYARLRFTSMDLPHLRTVAEGGGKLTDARFRELADWAARTGRRFFATFGTTETSARLAYLPPELANEKTGSIGRAIPGGRLFLVDGEGRAIEGEEAEGELCYSGPNVTMGYARCREDLALGDEWRGTYRTGDLARRDADGCYYVTGRLSRFLKLLGHRVSLDQCERLVAERLGVPCACIGTDERMEVYVEGNNTSDVIEVLATILGLRESLFSGHSIKKLPRNDSGKIAYAQLAEGERTNDGQ